MALRDWLKGRSTPGQPAENGAALDSSAARSAAPPASGLVRDLTVVLAELSRGHLSAEEIDPSGHLFDFGYVDSLTAVTFVEHIERHYEVVIEDVELIDHLTSVAAIARHIEEAP